MWLLSPQPWPGFTVCGGGMKCGAGGAITGGGPDTEDELPEPDPACAGPPGGWSSGAKLTLWMAPWARATASWGGTFASEPPAYAAPPPDHGPQPNTESGPGSGAGGWAATRSTAAAAGAAAGTTTGGSGIFTAMMGA